MNRNNEAHFNQVPNLEITRSRFKRDQDIKLTFDAGKLIPFYVDEVLPGDTFSIDQSAIIRMTTPIFPVMDNAYLDYYYFFVPNRIVWEHWKEFMGEVTDEPWVQTVEYTVPTIKITGTSDTEKLPKEASILDYMGIPTKFLGNGKTAEVNALPIRAYIKIWNEWFRDQNVDNPAINNNTDATVNYNDDAEDNLEKILQQAYTGGRPLPVSRFHDYFSSCLPSPQRANEPVTIPITNGLAPVYMYNLSKTKPIEPETNQGVAAIIQGKNTDLDVYKPGQLTLDTENEYPAMVDLSKMEVTTVNQLRQAFQVQKYFEELARGGSRYREQIYSLFRTRISDKTVQVPEYLGGDRVMINMSQVVQTSSTNTESPQGNVAAMSVTGFKKSTFTKSFEEHGWIIGVCCVRHDHTYQQGIERMWSRKNKLDFSSLFSQIWENRQCLKRSFTQAAKRPTKKRLVIRKHGQNTA